MPLHLIEIDCSPLVIDYEYEIADLNLLAEFVGEIILGNHRHILNVINSLSTSAPINPDRSIENVIKMLKIPDTDKRDGWLFQMISWISLAIKNNGEKYFSQHPHFAPAQHGIDGLGIILNADDTISKIIITEDKCTSNPRKKIREEVFPEFQSFEDGIKDHALIGILSNLLSNIDAGKVLLSVQNDIFNNDFRQYRVGITRETTHNSIEGRKRLFADYDGYVIGDLPTRRSGSTIYIDDLRNWMNDFAGRTIAFLESKKTGDV